MVTVEIAGSPTSNGAGDPAEMMKESNEKVAEAVWTKLPEVPVMVRLYNAALVDVQVRVAVPEPVIMVGVKAVQVIPVGRVPNDSVTVDANPFWAPMVMVDVAAVVPSAGAVGGEVALIVKSGGGTNVKEAVTVWTSEPLVPVMVTE